MSEFWQGVLAGICSNSLLGVLIGFWLNRELQAQGKRWERINADAQARFNKYHLDSVDAITQTYALLVEVHNSVFQYCSPDWFDDHTPPEDRKKTASACMVAFYEYFRKHQIFMEDTTIEHFEKSFRFLQEVFLKKDAPDISPKERVQVGMVVYADMTKTLPGMLKALKDEIKRKIGPEQGAGKLQ
jgi:hypothetical protein